MHDLDLALYIAGALLVILVTIGLGLLWGGLRRLIRGRLFSGGSRMLAGLVLLLTAALAVAVAVDLRSYVAFTHEQPVASIGFTALGPQYFQARLKYAAGAVTQTELRGDEWQLDARVIKWRGLATLLGFSTLYRLERLSGRYRSVAQEQQAAHTAVALSAGGWLDSWALVHRFQDWLPWVDAGYGSSVYLPMADGAEYRVSLSTTGLVARPQNDSARQAMAQW